MLSQSRDGGVLHLRLEEPVRPGEAADRLAWELLDVCEEIEGSPEPPLAVALSGAGSAFWLESPRGPADLDALGPTWPRATAALAGISPPTVAAIGGDALGPAWDLALACDLRVAAESARVGHPEVRLGRLPVGGGTQRLARLVGPALALRLLLLGELVDGAAAAELGLVHRVAPGGSLDAALAELLAGLRGGSPIALTYVKETVRRAGELPLAEGLRLEADLAALLQTTRDRAEGLAAFLERRTPSFEGR